MNMNIVLAYRNMLTQKVYNLINISSLIIGITSCLLLSQYIIGEFSYDKQHNDYENIFRVTTQVQMSDNEFHAATSPAPLARILLDEVPEVKETTRVVGSDRSLIKLNGDSFFEKNIFYAQSSIFNFFNYEFLEGNPQTSLKYKNSIVLTESLAKKLFGKTSVLNEMLEIDDGYLYKVTGVIKDPIGASHFMPRGFFSLESLGKERDQVWASLNDYTFLRVLKNTNTLDLESKIEGIYSKYVKEVFSRFNATAKFNLQGLKDIHFGERLKYELDPTQIGNISDVYLLMFIAIIIVTIATVNYIILAVAGSTKRAKEVGIKKVHGAYKSLLIREFLYESIIIVSLSVLASLVLLFIVLPVFNEISSRHFLFINFFMPTQLFILLAISIIIGIAGGLYPAFYLSSFNPTDVLKSSMPQGSSKFPLKNILLIVQFSLTMVMLVSTYIVYSQLQFLNDKNLGFNKEQVLKLELIGKKNHSMYKILKQDLLTLSSIKSVGSANATPGGDGFTSNSFNIEKEGGGVKVQLVKNFNVSEEFIPLMEMTLIEGRNFDKNIATDNTGIIVNQLLVKELGWSKPIGKQLDKILNQDFDKITYRVIGVIEDFHIKALYEKLEPTALIYKATNPYLLLKIQGGNLPSTIEDIRTIWNKHINDQPFEVKFIDEEFSIQYQAEDRKGNIFSIFTLLSIFITFSGLFGLASFEMKQRTKELAIRKVLGAGTARIMLLVTSEFITLWGVSMILAFPIAYYFMADYLQNFHYHISITSFPFLVTAISTLLIITITIGVHVNKAVSNNPIHSLKEE